MGDCHLRRRLEHVLDGHAGGVPAVPAPWVCSADKEQYGWAAGLDKPTAPTFRDLEGLRRCRTCALTTPGPVTRCLRREGSFLNESIWGETIYRETSYNYAYHDATVDGLTRLTKLMSIADSGATPGAAQ